MFHNVLLYIHISIFVFIYLITFIINIKYPLFVLLFCCFIFASNKINVHMYVCFKNVTEIFLINSALENNSLNVLQYLFKLFSI